MRYVRKSSFTRTVKFRLTLIVGTILGFTTIAVLAFLYGDLGRALADDVDRALIAEFREFQSIYRDGGMEALRREFEFEENAQGMGRVFATVFDAKGSVIITSNLRFWGKQTPPAIPPTGDTPIVSEADTVHGRGDARRLYGKLSPDLYVLMGRNADHIDAVLASYRHRGSRMALVALVLGIIGAWLVARRAMAGVELVTESAETIAGGALDHRIGAAGFGEEIDRLVVVLNEMLGKIETLVKERKNLNDSIAHELRSPLTRIRGAAEMAITRDTSAESWRTVAAEIVEACDGLLGMVSSMLAISEMEAGVATVEAFPVDLSKLLEDTCEWFQPAAEDSEIQLKTQIPEGIALHGDESRLRQAMANLLDNALKYTAAGGVVTVALDCDDKGISIRVTDTGRGFFPYDIAHIFERFYRAPESVSKPGHCL